MTKCNNCRKGLQMKDYKPKRHVTEEYNQFCKTTLELNALICHNCYNPYLYKNVSAKQNETTVNLFIN